MLRIWLIAADMAVRSGHMTVACKMLSRALGAANKGNQRQKAGHILAALSYARRI